MKEEDLAIAIYSVAFIVAVFLEIWVGATSLHWCHTFMTEAGLVLMFSIGLGFCGYILREIFGFSSLMVNPESFSEIFYLAFLPPIIFASGYSMKLKNFFDNLGSILTLAVVATIISGAVYGLLMWGATVYGFIPGSTNLLQHLILGAVLSATDTVAIIALFTELNVDPTLFNLVFGESVLNDAVAIVLFRTLVGFEGTSINSQFFKDVSISFSIIALGSVAVGASVGLISAWLLRRLKNIQLSPTFEFALLVVFAYLSYVLAEALEFSGIVSVFVLSIVMAHYHWKLIGKRTKISSYVASGGIGYLCETSCFIALGLCMFNRENALKKSSWNIMYCLCALLSCWISRALAVILLSNLLNLGRKIRISWKMMIIQWFAGLRGAVAIILALSKDLKKDGEDNVVFVNAVYVIVIVTNLVMGAFTKPLISLLKIPTGGKGESINMRPLEEEEENEKKEREEAVKKEMSGWEKFDNKYLQPYFGKVRRHQAKPEHVSHHGDTMLNIGDTPVEGEGEASLLGNKKPAKSGIKVEKKTQVKTARDMVMGDLSSSEGTDLTFTEHSESSGSDDEGQQDFFQSEGAEGVVMKDI